MQCYRWPAVPFCLNSQKRQKRLYSAGPRTNCCNIHPPTRDLLLQIFGNLLGYICCWWHLLVERLSLLHQVTLEYLQIERRGCFHRSSEQGQVLQLSGQLLSSVFPRDKQFWWTLWAENGNKLVNYILIVN